MTKYKQHAITTAVSIVLAILCPLVVSAQVPVSLSPVPHMQFLNNSGLPLASGCVFTYQAGTTNPAATYVDSLGVSTNTNPIILNAGGFADIWLPNAAFKFTVKSSGGVNCASGATLWTVDNITGVLGLLNLNNVWTGTNSFSQQIAITTNTNQIALGTPGNQVTLNAPAPASNVTLTLPITTDTLVGRATTDTLTNKTLASPTITTPVLNGTPTGTSLQGTDTKILTSGAVSGTGASLCTDALGGATTSGCTPPAAAFLGCTAIGPATITNNNTQQNLLSCTIPANTFSAGSLLNVNITGIISIASAGTFTIGMSLGAGTPCLMTASAGVANNQPWNSVGKFFVLTAGAGGTANWSCEIFPTPNTGNVVGANGTIGAPTIAINTTISNILQITVQMSVANAGNSTTEQGLKSVIF